MFGSHRSLLTRVLNALIGHKFFLANAREPCCFKILYKIGVKNETIWTF